MGGPYVLKPRASGGGGGVVVLMLRSGLHPVRHLIAPVVKGATKSPRLSRAAACRERPRTASPTDPQDASEDWCTTSEMFIIVRVSFRVEDPPCVYFFESENPRAFTSSS